MASMISITINTQTYQFFLDLLKDVLNSLSPLVQSLEKLCQAVVVRNDQTNLQPTLKNVAWGASLTIFVTDCSFTTNVRNIFIKAEQWVNNNSM